MGDAPHAFAGARVLDAQVNGCGIGAEEVGRGVELRRIFDRRQIPDVGEGDQISERVAIESAWLPLRVDLVAGVRRLLRENVAERAGQQPAPRLRGVQTRGVVARVAAGFHESAQHLVRVAPRVARRHHGERAARSEKTRHPHQARGGVGDEIQHVQGQHEVEVAAVERCSRLRVRLIESRHEDGAGAKMRLRLEPSAIIPGVTGVGFDQGNGNFSRQLIGQQGEGLPVAAADVQQTAARRNGFGGDFAQGRDEMVPLIGAAHPHASKRVVFENPREGVPVLRIAVQAFELVAHQRQRFVESKRQIAGHRGVNRYRHGASPTRLTAILHENRLRMHQATLSQPCRAIKAKRSFRVGDPEFGLSAIVRPAAANLEGFVIEYRVQNAK